MHQQHFCDSEREPAHTDLIAHIDVEQKLITNTEKIKAVGSTVQEAVPHPLKQPWVSELIDLLWQQSLFRRTTSSSFAP
jgi:hypothetical protein